MGKDLMDDAELLAEKLDHAIDLLKVENGKIRDEKKHEKEFIEHRISSLECNHSDHEDRIRILQEEVTMYKTRALLVSGAAGLVALLALVKAFLVN